MTGADTGACGRSGWANSAAGVVETHSGIVFFVDGYAYKLKKPVQLSFLDFRRREVREAICDREVELNRRLAPDVYCGVADVVGPDGSTWDHLVVMRRLPADRRLATMAAGGTPMERELRQLAHLLAAFHARADTSAEIDAAASRDAQAARWATNATEMQRFVGALLDPPLSHTVLQLARSYLAGRAPLFAERIAGGHARDGHGDLLADDIFCLEDGPRVLDCLEFDDRLRWGDTLADVAFLAMDLERLGRADLARRFLTLYQQFTADVWPRSMAHHYIAYRAQVRCKVACLRWEQGDSSSANAARELLTLTFEHLDAGRVRLILVGGLPGTGKSTLAAGVAGALGAVLLRSDEVRKQLVGLDTVTPAPATFTEGVYRSEVTAATYSELLAFTRVALGHGESVVLDASWHEASWRDQAAEVASQAVADFDQVRCVAPWGVIDARLASRSVRGGDTSDATSDIARTLATIEAPWPAATSIDTTEPVDEVLATALTMLRLTPSVGGAPPTGR